NINSIYPESEFLITLHGAFAQAESESTSSRVRWGKQQAMRSGHVTINYKNLLGYEKGPDGKPAIVPEQAETVRFIYDRYLAGDSIREIKAALEERKVPTVSGKEVWMGSHIRSILTNEKYCGDVLLQKTFIQDCISKKVIPNTGQLPKYLIQNHHEGIVSREIFDAVQLEMARR
ncbi:recombinase, partial [Clostridium sp. ATCC BAA-442]